MNRQSKSAQCCLVNRFSIIQKAEFIHINILKITILYVVISSFLIFLGYKTVHRRTGFDLETTQAILATLAKFHGSSLGMKLQKPKEFKDKILPYLGKFYTTACFEKEARSHMIEVLTKEHFSPLIIARAVATFDRKCCLVTQEPWATFTHTNAWVS